MLRYKIKIVLFYVRYLINCRKISFLYNRRALKEKFNCGGGTAHVIGSGQSLLKTKHKIENDDFVVGNNFACLSDIAFDVYLLEFFGNDISAMEALKNAIKEKLKLKKNGVLISKNIFYHTNIFKKYYSYYQKNPSVLADIVIDDVNELSSTFLINSIVNQRHSLYIQALSSVLTMIDISVSIGSTKIVLHGVDHGGKYFYQDDSSIPNYLIPSNTTLYPSATLDYEKHSSHFSKEFNLKNVIVKLATKLNDQGIQLIYATE